MVCLFVLKVVKSLVSV
uniref:Uncharacterized protein n=1 Tax=Arundo donax TaxID=35708 RepID=A0A0A8Z6K5_ARUDO